MSHIDFLLNGWETRAREGMQCAKPLRASQAYTLRQCDQCGINGGPDHGLQYLMKYPRLKYLSFLYSHGNIYHWTHLNVLQIGGQCVSTTSVTFPDNHRIDQLIYSYLKATARFAPSINPTPNYLLPQ